jgi:hypothetical protein
MLGSGAVHWETEADITLHYVVSTNMQRKDLRESTGEALGSFGTKV